MDTSLYWLAVLALELRDADLRPLASEGGGLVQRAAELLAGESGNDLLAAPGQRHERAGLQLVLARSTAAVPVLRLLAEASHPHRWVVGLGFGRVLRTNGEDESRLRGSAFDHARAALWDARRERRSTAVRGFGSPEDETLAALIELMDQLRVRWTPRQCETVRAARSATGREVAQRFGVSPSVVSESLKAAGYRALLRAEEALAAMLAVFGTTSPWLGDHLQLPDLTAPIDGADPRSLREQRASA